MNLTLQATFPKPDNKLNAPTLRSTIITTVN